MPSLEKTSTPCTPSRRGPAWRALNASLGLALALVMAAVACTSNDTLFVQLTATPIPSLTPTPLAEQTRYRSGESVVIVGVSAFSSLQFAPLPGPFRPGVPGGANCFPNQAVTVIDVSRNTADPADDTIYYQVTCSGTGWAPEYNLTRYMQYSPAVVQSEDGQGAIMYRGAEVTAGTELANRCPEGTRVSVEQVTNNPFDRADANVYVGITCDGQRGYVIDQDLEPVSGE